MKSAIALFLVLCIVMSGCIEEKSNSGIFTKTDNAEEKTVGVKGGNIFFLEYHVYTDFPENAVNNEINITVTEISSYPEKEDIKFMNVYHFEPDGINFEKPVKIGINYNSEEIPENISEDNIKLFIYQGGKWNEIEDSQPTGSYVAGYVSNFCFIASGYYLQHAPNPDASDENNSNHSAVWTFEVPVRFVTDEETIMENYTAVIAYIAWTPCPYVRFYQLYFHYNGNNPEDWITGCDWTEMKENKFFCHHEKYFFKENQPYLLTRDGEYVPDAKGSILVGKFSSQSLNLFEEINGTHNLQIGNIGEHFDRHGIKDPVERGVITKEMQEFMENYFEGWTVTVRAVS